MDESWFVVLVVGEEGREASSEMGESESLSSPAGACMKEAEGEVEGEVEEGPEEEDIFEVVGGGHRGEGQEEGEGEGM